MSTSELWNCEETVDSLLDDIAYVPRWVEELTGGQVAAVCQGGCASGAYMPAVTYHEARTIMGEHGDDVLEYLEKTHGELPIPPDSSSWSGIAVHYLSNAVDLWCCMVHDDIEEVLRERSEEAAKDLAEGEGVAS